ncbi:MAG: hypothetical protein K2Z81_01565, partial [Cyanobacteria bacterium]|nr:hypothetical protein [Cyanobacteriota bacterium]
MLSTTETSRTDSKVGSKRVFLFSDAFKTLEGDREAMRELLGGKGAGLAEMTSSGVSVPPGLTILTTCCREYSKTGKF